MLFNIGDYVSRNSHQNDILFKIIDIKENIAYLKGVNIRLIADSNINDLRKEIHEEIEDDDKITKQLNNEINLERNEFFYLPGKILHIDGDSSYLKRCLKLYKKLKIMAYGVSLKESEIVNNIYSYLEDINPDIVVITGHDAYYNKRNNKSKTNQYKNSENFKQAIIEARKYEKSQEKLIIIAGACQSNYEELIKAGANFASSPKRINIHALDPAIVASLIALSNKNESIDLMKIINSTKYKEEGIGGIITNGTMYVGYPR